MRAHFSRLLALTLLRKLRTLFREIISEFVTLEEFRERYVTITRRRLTSTRGVIISSFFKKN